jgi:hypothetical protein
MSWHLKVLKLDQFSLIKKNPEIAPIASRTCLRAIVLGNTQMSIRQNVLNTDVFAQVFSVNFILFLGKH